MWYYVSKIFISALMIVAISEIAKRNSGFAALVASLPLISLMAIIWLRIEGAQVIQIAELSQQIFWLVLPSLVLFLVLPLLLKYGITFWLSLGLASAATVLCYFLMIVFLRRFGVTI